MLISDSKKFLFIHIQKTGGTSLRACLKAMVPDLEEYDGMKYHARLSDALTDPRFGSGEYFTAAFVRNPWDRLVSWYVDIVTNADVGGGGNLIRQGVMSRAHSFEEFIKHCPDLVSRAGRMPFSLNQIDYLTNNGDLAVDFIGRFEKFEESAATLIRSLGLPETRVPHLNRSRHDGYRAYYTEETKEIVQTRFRRDIDAFGYAF